MVRLCSLGLRVTNFALTNHADVLLGAGLDDAVEDSSRQRRMAVQTGECTVGGSFPRLVRERGQ